MQSSLLAFIFLITGTTNEDIKTTANEDIKTEYDVYESCETLDNGFVKLEEKAENGYDYDSCEISENDIKTREQAFMEFIDEKITGNGENVAEVEDEIYNRCYTCQISFRFDRQYVEHCKRIHGKEFAYACNICQRVFRVKNKLILHEGKYHFEGKRRNSSYPANRKKTPVFCEICAAHFPGYKAFEQHASSAHEGVKMMSCPHCPKKYTRRKAVVEHIRREHDSHPSLKCNFCQNVFERSDLLKDHEMDCERRQMARRKRNIVLDYNGPKWGENGFDECGDDFNALGDHYESGHPSTNLHRRYYCEEEFGDKNTLEKHLDMTRADKSKDIDVWKKHRKGCVYACVHCDGKLIVGLQAYERHGKEEHRGRPMWFCKTCKKGFSTRGSLWNHSVDAHNNRYDTKRICPYCNKLYYRLDRLRKHEVSCEKKHREVLNKRECEGGFSFYCEICRKNFDMTNSQYQWHERRHRDYDICLECGDGFNRTKNPDGLTRHIQSRHYGNKRVKGKNNEE